MMTISKALAKGTIASVAAGVMVVAPLAAQAQERRDHDRIDAGDVIAGALIIGGIAAVASAAGNGRYYDRDDDRDGYHYRDRDYRSNYDNYGNYGARDAVERCVRTAERDASGHSWRGRSKVTDVRDIDRIRGGYRISGRIAVNQMGRDWDRRDSRYGRGWDSDYRGWNDSYRGWDSGRFTCFIERGRVVDIDYSGIRGLR
jgi:hypothetical protein